MSEVFQRGDFVEASADGKTVKGMVTLASPNGQSLIIMFDDMLDGHVGMMALSGDGRGFVSLMTGTPVTLKRMNRGGT
jgi:hypothetical protein